MSKLTEEEIELIREHRRKKAEMQSETKPKEAELDLKEIEQELVDEEEENICASCGWKFNGKPEKCPQCDVELDWENIEE